MRWCVFPSISLFLVCSILPSFALHALSFLSVCLRIPPRHLRWPFLYTFSFPLMFAISTLTGTLGLVLCDRLTTTHLPLRTNSNSECSYIPCKRRRTPLHDRRLRRLDLHRRLHLRRRQHLHLHLLRVWHLHPVRHLHQVHT